MASTVAITRPSLSPRLRSSHAPSPSLPSTFKRTNNNPATFKRTNSNLPFRPHARCLTLRVTTGDASVLALPLALVLQEPSNALSLPTWVVHVSSVVEWITAMALVWRYGEKSGHRAWKGLSWGMVPLLGGAMCACTWHFFYNSESLEILVAIQGALTTIGNTTMLIAAFRIFKASDQSSTDS